ncbi:uncharacterized protein LOC144344223 [Saccoglossus kowalevskii]
MDGPAEQPMIGISLMEDFLNGLPSMFEIRWNDERGHSEVHQDPSRVNVFVHSDRHAPDFPNTQGGLIQIETEDEFEVFATSFVAKPLFLDVFSQNRKRSGNFRVITSAYFAVLVNTKHPHIKEQLQRGIDEARKYISNGEKFALEFDFSDLIKEWFADTLGGDTLCQGSYYSKYGRICITNHTKYHHCFDCSPETVDLWICCLPCCLVMCPAYTAYRKFTCKDIGISMTGTICALALGNNTARRSNNSTDIEVPTRVILTPPTYEQTTGQESVVLPTCAPPSYDDITKETTSDTSQLI